MLKYEVDVTYANGDEETYCGVLHYLFDDGFLKISGNNLQNNWYCHYIRLSQVRTISIIECKRSGVE